MFFGVRAEKKVNMSELFRDYFLLFLLHIPGFYFERMMMLTKS